MNCTHQRISMLSGDCCDCDKPALVLVRESRIRIVTLEAERDAAIEREADLRTALAVVQEQLDELRLAHVRAANVLEGRAE